MTMLSLPLAPAACRLVAATLLAACNLAAANDRPYEMARTAVSEDDDQVWSFESWVRRVGSQRSFSVEPEYVFNPADSVQVELTRKLDRRGDDAGHEAEIEYKHLFNNLARDGWGWAFSAALGAERSAGRTAKAWTMRVPLTLDLGQLLGQAGGGPLLHLNAGLYKVSDTRRAWTTAFGAEHQVARRSLLFAEWARQGDEQLTQLGLRHWIKRDKLALDFAWQQRQTGGARGRGWIAGIGWYDL